MPSIFSRTGCSPYGPEQAVRGAPANPGGDVARARTGHLAARVLGSSMLLLLALVLTACGGGGGAQSAGSSADYAAQDEGAAVPSGASGGGEAASAGASASAGAAASSSAAQDVGVGSGEGSRAALPGFDGEKIVKTAELAVRTEDVREGAARAQEIAARFGGSVSSSRIDDEGGGSVSADLVLSVPSSELEAALDELRDLGDATTDTVGGEDVTEEFVDLKSRERNLLWVEESLLRLYEEEEIEDYALS